MWDKPRVLNWIANFLNALAAVIFLYGLVYVVVHLPIFPLREVRVDGQLEHVTREQIKLIAERHLQGNFFTVDVLKARDAFQKLPWARKVSVRKRWPDRLEVVIEEQHELARWGNIALVNTYGELFHAASDSDLPVFYGPGDAVAEVAKQYGVYSQILAGGTGSHITQLALTSRRAWQIKTDKGLVIELGREQVEERLRKFANAYSHTLGGVKVAITYVDLRYPNGFAVRKPEVTTSKRKTGAA
ncbi:cell division protein FtsQ [Methylobacillus rhizosphaerae]|uniref:Cell division protein FtsQ n=1 Tax=Methylobacillus rhizosphaerae TaxID=551994 RepID=A0A238XZL4_9PROT|nr:cell division protein FtsQ/DivIB [Methylobacillus rhizosphaerae]SNR64008.1 cell division protein FtsQ [Methylobacillus rhizosphaerae]